MDHLFTMELHLLRVRSQYLQDLFVALSEDSISQLTISPPDDLIKGLKSLAHQGTEGD